jgi:hypothetical protein
MQTSLNDDDTFTKVNERIGLSAIVDSSGLEESQDPA